MTSTPCSSMVRLMSSVTGTASGSDRTADQRALLRRVAEEWLTEGGTALIDISNPFVWARWDGDQEHKPTRPEDGYDYDLGELTQFDPIRNRFADTWWATDNPGEKWTQSIRCYTPADLRLLLEGTGLTLDAVLVSGEIVDLDEPSSVLFRCCARPTSTSQFSPADSRRSHTREC